MKPHIFIIAIAELALLLRFKPIIPLFLVNYNAFIHIYAQFLPKKTLVRYQQGVDNLKSYQHFMHSYPLCQHRKCRKNEFFTFKRIKEEKVINIFQEKVDFYILSEKWLTNGIKSNIIIAVI